MVYYSPCKKIIKAFLRAIRVFISSLFSKRLLLMIIVALVIMLLHLNVNADSEFDDGYAYRYVSEPEYDSTADSYKYSYRLFNVNGVQEGDFLLPASMYNNNIYIISIGNDGKLYYWLKNSSNPTETLYHNKHYNNGLLYQSFVLGGMTFTADRYIYDFETDTWSGPTSFNNSSSSNFLKRINESLFNPDNIILTKNCSIQGYDYNGTQNMASYLIMRDSRRLKTPTLSYFTDTGFRLYLNDFIPFDSNEYQDLNLGYSTVDTVTINFTLYDLENHEYILSSSPLQLQDIDDQGNYYIDLPFYASSTLSTNLRYMINNGGDYLLLFNTNLTNNKLVDGMPSMFTITTLYNSFDYFRFRYNVNTSTGILTSVYSDGTEKPNQNNSGDSGEETNTSDNQTANVINELGNTIINQTTIIQEQSNTINDMSNFIQDDDYSSNTITNNMPSSEEFQDITENGFDNIFTTLRNTFTSDNYQDLVFTIPFTNGKSITIPSNLTENIIPAAIKNLIQMVYWYLIARFIVKDIAGYIEKAKSGDIFNSSDSNIKTDML